MNRPLRHLALAAALLPAACARLSAPNVDFAGPTPSVDVKATQVNAFFSHFTGGLTVSVSVQPAGPVAPATTAMPAGATTGAVTYRLSAMPTFTVGDILNVTWSAPAATLLGSPYTITQAAQYRIAEARLQVQTPPQGLGPNTSGRVCVALLPNAPADARVTLQSSAVSVAPATLQVRAGQSRATVAATATMGGFSCPLPARNAATPVPNPPPCTDRNGVVATATFNGVTVHGCSTTAPSCCGITQACTGTVPQPASICP